MCTYWITGSSIPCIAVFKPFWPIPGEELTFSEKRESFAIEFWKLRERLHRMIIQNRIEDLPSYIRKRDSLEQELDDMVSVLDECSCKENELLKIMNYAIEKERELILQTIIENQNNRAKIKGNIYFRSYWKKQNRKLLKDN